MKRELLFSVNLFVLSMLSVTFAFAQCVPPLSGTAMWIPGEGTTQDVVTVSSGTSVAAPVNYIPAVVGQGISFNGASQVEYDISSIGPALQDGFSFDLWLKVGNAGGNVFDLRGPGGFGGHLASVTLVPSIFPGNAQTSIRIETSGVSGMLVPVAIPIGPSAPFVFIAGSYNGSHIAMRVNSHKFYGALAPPQQVPLGGAPVTLVLGKGIVYGDYLNGTIDEFELLTDSHSNLDDFDGIFNAGSTGKCPWASIMSLTSAVTSLSLSSGVENSLLAKIETADSQYTNENDVAGNNALGAFVNQVGALENSDVISSSAADQLTNIAEAIIDQHS